MNLSYVYTILCIILSDFSLSQAQQGVFLLSKRNEALCVLNGESTRSGVSWTISATNTTKTPIDQIPEYKPSLDRSHLDCSFEDDCKKRWNDKLWGVHSSIYHPFAPRVDSGWNEFPTLYSRSQTCGDIPSENKIRLDSNDDNPMKFDSPMYVSVSVKTAGEAVVLLCDQEDFFTGECYIVLISGLYNDRNAVVGKCTQGLQSETIGECDIMKDHEELDLVLVDDNSWQHFTFIIKTRERKTEIEAFAKLSVNDYYRKILDYQDADDSSINIKYLGVKSYNQNALWKIHKYNFLWSTKVMTGGTLYFSTGKPFKFDHNKNYLCLRMSIVLCSSCSFQLFVEDGKEKFYSRIISGKQRKQVSNVLANWEEEIFEIKLSEDRAKRSLLLRFSTNAEPDTVDQFWGIDNVKECIQGDVKTLKNYEFQEGDTCELLDQRISNEKYNTSYLFKLLPDCSVWNGWEKSCRGIKVWNRDGSTYECYPGYNGDLCEDITVLVTEFDTITTKYKNLVVKPKHLKAKGTRAEYMTIQYQYQLNDDYWRDIGEPQLISKYLKEFNIPEDIAKSKLLSGEQLVIRIILNVDGDKEFGSVDGTRIPVTCVEPSDVKLNSTVDTITFGWKVEKSVCPIEYYEIRTANKAKYCSESKNECIIPGLESGTEYSVTFTGKRDETFTKVIRTLDEAPGPVQEFEVYSTELDSVSLRWKPPSTNGKLEHYIISYNEKSTENRKSVKIPGSTCSLWPDYTCYTLKDLKAETYYDIKIRAYSRSTKSGEADCVAAFTEQGQSSAPKNVRQNKGNPLQISWQHPWTPNGKIEYFSVIVNIKSTNLRNNPSIPEQQIIVVEEDLKEYEYTITDLQPASKYSVKVIGNNRKEGKSSKELEITTSLTKPDITGELEIYKIEENKLSIMVPSGDENITKQRSFNVFGVYIIIIENNSKKLIDAKKRAYNKYKKDYKSIWNLTKKLEKNYALSWIAKKLSEIPYECTQIIIGTNATENKFWDAELSPSESNYTIAVVYYNELNGQKSYIIKSSSKIKQKNTDLPKSSSSPHHLYSLLLLVLVPIIAFIFYKRCITDKGKRPTAPEIEESGNNLVLTKNFGQPSNHTPLIAVAKPHVNVRPQNSFTINDESKINPVTQVKFTGPISRPVEIDKFEQYVKQSLMDGELEKQHKIFKRGMLHNVAFGTRKENRKKNRYLNLIAYDSTRVILEKIPHDPFSDYINANYIDGYERAKEYIATQGPKENTVEDFWRMVWQEKVTVICMLTNTKESGKEKCYQYWPITEGTEEQYGDIAVSHISSTICADYIFRTFNINYGESNYKLDHLHFTAWPDHGVPLYPKSVVSYIEKMQELQSLKKPTIVHCSAGVGRTGTIILSDICIKMARAVDKIDVLYHQNRIRQQRPNLVDNTEQYKLVHMILVESLFGEQTSIPCNELRNKVNEMRSNNTLLDKWKNLDKEIWKDNFTKCSENEPVPVGQKRKEDRNNIIPGARDRVFLPRFPVSAPDSDYINAVYVDGFRVKDQFIVTQFPLAHTIADYWRMIADKDITLVAVLNEIDTTDESVQNFVPDQTAEIMSPIPEITIRYIHGQESEFCHISTVLLHDRTKTEELSRTLTLVKLKHWKAGENLPSGGNTGIEHLLKLWQQLEKFIHKAEPILITCYDGAIGCGLFTALTFVIEKIKLEHECDVPLAVRTVRRHRQEMLRSEEQFDFLYEAALKFLDGFEIYSNFQ